MLSFVDARRKVIATARAQRRELRCEAVKLREACGRVLAQPITADRDYPPFDRSTRDGFAVRSADARKSAVLRLIGEIKAGSGFSGAVRSGECVQIMTGAAVPAGADAVVMIEHVRFENGQVTLSRDAAAGQNIVKRGSEARKGQELLPAGMRFGYAEMALAGQVGAARVNVYTRPRVAILSTGDEVVDITAAPGELQIRNSNGLALETLVSLAGAEPDSLGNAPDESRALRERIERGLTADVLVLSGGVSMGKYDLVEGVLAELGSEFFFDAVDIRPGRPAVFGRRGGTLIFGLPGNPVSTMVTFELFALPALDILSGTSPRPLGSVRARLTHDLHERGALTHFIPARLEQSGDELEVSALPWRGSGDTVTFANSNALLMIPPERLDWAAGDWVSVIPRRGPGGFLA